VYQSTGDLDLEVVVVENGSGDGSAEMVKQNFPQVRLMENRINIGFASANNQGAELASGRYILFLNPDTVVRPNALDSVVGFVDQHQEIGVVGCRILNPDGSLQHSCRSFPSLLNYFFESTFLYRVFPRNSVAGSFYMTGFDHDQTREVDVVLGAFLLIRRDIFEGLGKFDERFFIYSEETDLCYRVKRAQKKVVFFSGAEITHHGGSSTSQDSVRMIQQDHRSRFLFLRKHRSGLTVGLSLIIMFVGVVSRSLLWSLTAAYFKVLDNRRLAGARKKMLTYLSLAGWYLRFGFTREVFPQARNLG
jgi:GT2 family glycosyltransferase